MSDSTSHYTYEDDDYLLAIIEIARLISAVGVLFHHVIKTRDFV